MRHTDGALSLFPEAPACAQRRPGRIRTRFSPTAAEASVTREVRRTRFRPLACSTVLNANSNSTLPFRWTINPYRGCEFGCSYCFARYTHGYLDHRDPKSFERMVYVKFQAAQVLAETLRPAAIRGRPIALGTATDPYQPAEKRFEVTRRILEVFARCPGVELSITTKSPMVRRDIDVLRQIARQGRLTVQITLLTLNPTLTRIVERRTPPPRLRLETIRALHEAKIEVGIFVMPILPGITDAADDLRPLLQEARAAGADYAIAAPPRLFGASWQIFEPVLQRHFPHLLKEYRFLRNERGSFPDEATRPSLERFRMIRSAAGLRSEPAARVAGEPRAHTPRWLFGGES